jgi:hypothetical protein
VCAPVTIEPTDMTLFKFGEVHPRTGHDGPEGQQRCSSLSLTSTLDGVRWSTQSLGHFASRKKTRYLSYRKLGGIHGRKFSPPSRYDPRTIKAVASRYTDDAIPAQSTSLRLGTNTIPRKATRTSCFSIPIVNDTNLAARRI